MRTCIIILTILTAAACAPLPVQNSTPAPGRVETATQAPSEATAIPTPNGEPGLQRKLTQLAVDDLATRLNLDIKAISVVSMDALVWPNAALGCPLPGKVYAEGTVPGFRIRLAAENKEYFYHTDRIGLFVLCLEESPEIEDLPSIPIPPGEIDDGEPWVPVD